MTIKQRWKPVLLTALAFATIPAALIYTDYAISNQSLPEQIPEKDNIPKVTTLSLSSGKYSSMIQAFGEVQAVEEVSLSSQISGRVIWRNSNLSHGAQIEKGDVLVRLDETDYKAALANARQTLAESSLALQQEKRQHSQAIKDWARSGIQQKASALALREPQLNAASARYKAAIAMVNQAKRDLNQTQISAPFNAVVIDRNITLGSYIESGSVLATLKGSDQAEVSLALSDQQWRQLPNSINHLKVDIYNPNDPSYQWLGQVNRLSSVIDHKTRLRNLIVTIDHPLNQSKPLLIGSFISASIQGAEIDNLLALPASALTADGYIWWVEENRLKRKSVKPVFDHQGQIFITDRDLPKQIQLVRKPLQSYLPEMRVKAQIAEATE